MRPAPSRPIATAVLGVTLLVTCAGLRAAAGKIEVRSLKLIGVQSIDEALLRSVLQTKADSWLPFQRPRYFEPEAFQRDLERIVAFYKDHGFPHARVVSSSIDYNKAHDAVNLEVRIEEGSPVLIDRVVFEGLDEVPAGEVRALDQRMPIRRGQPVVQQDVLTTGQMVANLLRDHGYPHVTVDVREEPVSPSAVVVRYRADPGPEAVFGPIEIAGNTHVSDAVIRRELAYRPGELFRRSEMVESQRHLYGLELFRFASVEASTANARETVIPTRVTVVEGKRQRIDFSGGYGTEEKVRGEARWRQLDFLGGARTLGVHGKWSSLDRGVEVEFTQPYLLRPDLAFNGQVHAWYSNEPAYTALSRGARATVTSTTRRRTISLTLVDEYDRSTISSEALQDPASRDELIALGLDPTTGRQAGTLLSWSVAIRRATTTDPLDPRRGYAVSAAFEQAGAWLPGSFDYYNVVAEGRHYLPAGGRVTVANRLRAGTIDGLGSTGAIPFFKRFFLGGSTSLRGWGRYEVSPLSPSGLPIGGLSLLEATSELRARVWGNLGVVVFVDAGNVWPASYEVRLNDLLYDAGPGLRYHTPIGPVRVDFAYQLNTLPGLRVNGELQQRRWRLHFSIGQSF